MWKKPTAKESTSYLYRDDSGVRKFKVVSISRLKAFVAENCPFESPLHIVLVDEDYVLSAEAFLAKLPIWLKLRRLSTRY